MKLISAKIENFGKLSDIKIDFSDSCQVFCHENGWGKSTLAAFLCVMFYGFSGEKKRDDLANERKRFEPWQKGVYGGTVTFFAGEKKYVLTRIFGKKEAQDEFSLRFADTNLESSDFSSNIGEELFRLDRESFQRSIFLSQHDCETYATDAINAKMGNLGNHTDDVDHFASAISRLKDITNGMRPNHKKGSLKQMKEQMGNFENQIRNEKILAGRMEETENLRTEQQVKCESLKERICKLERKQRKLSGELDLKTVRTEYRTLCDACTEEKRMKDELAQCFADAESIPDIEEISDWQEQEKMCRELRGYVRENTLSEQEEQKYEETLARWGGECLAEDQINQMERAYRELMELRKQITPYKLTEEEEQAVISLEKKYRGNVPDTEQGKALLVEFDKAYYKDEGLAEKKMALETLECVAENKTPFFLLCLLGASCVCAGAVLLIWQMVLGMCAMLFGVVVFICSVCIKNRSVQTKLQQDKIFDLKEQIREDYEWITATVTRVNDFLGVGEETFTMNELREELECVVNDAERYQRIMEKRCDQSVQMKQKRAEQLGQVLGEFLREYRGTAEKEDWALQLAELRTLNGTMQQWKKKKQDRIRASEALREQETGVREFLRSMGCDEKEDREDALRTLYMNTRDYQGAAIRYEKALKRKHEFEEKHDMDKIVNGANAGGGEKESISDLTEEIREARDRQKQTEESIRGYQERLLEDQERWDAIQEVKVELQEMQEKYTEGLHKYELLCKTMELLQEAKDNLIARYLEPVKKGFDKYYHMVMQEHADKFRFDAGVKLTVTEDGWQRDTKFLSEGCRDLIGICTRLALVDAMYQGEKPFLILDDPFADLDEKTTEGALALLKRVSEQYQVVYFTCHDSRVPSLA